MHYGGAERERGMPRKRKVIKAHSVSLCMPPPHVAFASVAAPQCIRASARRSPPATPDRSAPGSLQTHAPIPRGGGVALRHAGVREPHVHHGQRRAWSICTSSAVHTGLFQSWNGAILNRGDQHVPRLKREWAPKFWPQMPWASLLVVCMSIICGTIQILAMVEKKEMPYYTKNSLIPTATHTVKQGSMIQNANKWPNENTFLSSSGHPGWTSARVS
jgi:hypothetical protein